MPPAAIRAAVAAKKTKGLLLFQIPKGDGKTGQYKAFPASFLLEVRNDKGFTDFEISVRIESVTN